MTTETKHSKTIYDMENDFIKLINTRRSCRKYKTQQVDDQLLEEVLKAGTYAPTGHGSQSPFIVAVQNSEPH